MLSHGDYCLFILVTLFSQSEVKVILTGSTCSVCVWKTAEEEVSLEGQEEKAMVLAEDATS